MKFMSWSWAGLGVLLVLAGCSTDGKVKVHNVSEMWQATPAELIQTFGDGQIPDHPYRQVALLTYSGVPGEYPAAVQAFQTRAYKLGADAILLLPSEAYTGEEAQRFEFRAVAIKYAQAQ